MPLPVEVSFPDAPGLPVSPATTIFVQSTDPGARFVAEFLAGLLTTLDQVFASATAHTVTFPNFYTGGESSSTVYVATTATA